jgi:hypothetical protein
MSVALGNGATAARVSLEDKILVRIQVPQLNSLARGSFVWSGSDPPVVGVEGGLFSCPFGDLAVCLMYRNSIIGKLRFGDWA